MLEILKQTFKEWQEDKVPMLAAAVAYYTMFSLAPLLIIVIAVMSFLGQGDAQAQIVGQISDAAGENVGELVGTMIENRQAEGGNVLATLVGIAILLVAATGVFSQLQTALNIIWDVKPDPEKSGIKQILRVRLASLGMVLAIGFVLLVSLVLSTVLSGLLSGASDALPGGGFLWPLLDWLISLAVITVLFAMIFKVLPDAKITWSTVWIGALATALLFVLGKWLLGLYLSRAAVAGAYGAAGSLVVLLLWVFYSAQILLMGGEFTQVYSKRTGHGIVPDDHAVRASGRI